MEKNNKVLKEAVKTAIKENKNLSKKKEIDKMISDQNWEEVNTIYIDLVKGIIEMGQYLSLCLANKDVYGYVDDKDKLNNLVICVTSDLKSFAEELKEISLQHKDKEGPLQNEDELFKCVNIIQEYEILQAKLFSVITPMHMEALTILSDANNKYITSKENNEPDKKDTTANEENENNE